MSDLLPGDGTVGFILPTSLDEPYVVKEWDEKGRLIRVQERKLRDGEEDPFSNLRDDDEAERLFWERTVQVSDTNLSSPPPPKWVKPVFFGAMIFNPAVWITVALKLFRNRTQKGSTST